MLKTLGMRTSSLAPPLLRLRVRDIVVHATDARGQQSAQGKRSNREQTHFLQYRHVSLGRVTLSLDDALLFDDMPCDVRVKIKRDATSRAVVAFRVRVAIDRVVVALTSADYLRFEVIVFFLFFIFDVKKMPGFFFL